MGGEQPTRRSPPRTTRRHRPRTRVCLRKGCGRRYTPRRWNQRYCQDPECLREVRRWQSRQRQRRRRASPQGRQQHRQAERARRPKIKALEEYDFTFPKRIPKQTILRFFDCDFVARHGCAVFIGPSGTGKTHLLTALGYAACQKGISVRFTRVVDMINALTTAHLNGTLGKVLRTYTKPELLLLDEPGYLPIDKRGADLMFQVVAARYEAGAIVVSTNRPFKDWGAVFDVDNTLATALIDRLMHHGEAIVIRGDRYRMKDKKTDSND